MVNTPLNSWPIIKMQQMANGRFMKSENRIDVSGAISGSLDFTSVYEHFNFDSSCSNRGLPFILALGEILRYHRNDFSASYAEKKGNKKVNKWNFKSLCECVRVKQTSMRLVFAK